MLNTVVLMGRLTAAPELKKTQSDVSICSFTVAVDRDYKDANGERQADFIRCVAWRQTAEFISKYFGKGAMIAVVGSIQSRQYEDKDGNKRTSIEVVAEKASFTGEKSENASGETRTPSLPGFTPPKGAVRQEEHDEPAQTFDGYDPDYQLPF